MSEVFEWVVALFAAYLLGSLPTGVLVGKLWRGVDVRSYGSGSTGATNVLRTLGPRAAAMVLLLDGVKGAAAVLVAMALSDSPVLISLSGILAIIGHSWPVFARFKGGKGVATGLGALVVIAPIAAAVAAIGVMIVLVTRYVSLGSMVGAAAGMAAVVVLILLDRMEVAYLIFAITAFVLIEIRHSTNVLRLLKGTENKLAGIPRPRRFRNRGSSRTRHP
ncbi:MAG: glycerol-3-phosphate 1-O-acyltransferase PlsY [Dehalococcoidia bacterium]